MKLFGRTLTGSQKTATQLVGVVVVMVGLTAAAVPFYNWFCKVTGYGGTTGVATAGSDVILDQTMKVRFDASLDRNMPWTFKPAQREMTVRIGETALAYYEAYNPTDRVIAGQATYNVVPVAAGGFFDKIECFCFTRQILRPGETVLMPVSFFVDPAIVKDREGQYLREITLSYTFYEAELSDAEQQAALTNSRDTAIETN